MGLVIPQHVESYYIRDQTHVPCTGRQIPIHYIIKEVHMWHFLQLIKNSYCLGLAQFPEG